MQDRICLVTGASTGIGKATALALAQQGATVVVVCRNAAKAEATVAGIRTQSGNQKVDALVADLSSQAAIHTLVAEFHQRYPALHVLVNNAGIAQAQRQLTVDGIEMTFAVNHLAYFLLARLLQGALLAGAPSRIINVSSAAHHHGRLDFDNLQGEKKYTMWGAYSLSKLCNLLFTFELSRRLDCRQITVNALHPGVISTEIFRETPRYLQWLARLFASDAGTGAETSVFLATAPEVAEVTGTYFAKRKPVEPAPSARDRDSASRLWRISETLVGDST